MGFWMDNGFDPNKFTIVDCGYVNHKDSRDNCDRLVKAMGLTEGQTRGIVAIVGAGRVLCRIPRQHLHILNRFKAVTKGGGYCWTTHTYGEGGVNFNLKYAL